MNYSLKKSLVNLVEILMYIFFLPFVIATLIAIFIGGMIVLIVMTIGIPGYLMYGLKNKLEKIWKM